MMYTSKDYLTHISECIDKYIDNHNLTVKCFAQLCGLSYNEVRLIVNREIKDVRISTLIILADYMNTSLESPIHIQTQNKEEILLHDLYIKLKTYYEYRL